MNDERETRRAGSWGGKMGRRGGKVLFLMANNLSAQTRCCAGPLPGAQVSACVSVNVLGEGPLPASYFLGGGSLD